MSYRTAAQFLLLSLTAISCSRRPAAREASGPERIAILRFENLSADASIDWMGRAFPQIVTRDLAGIPSIYALPFERLHSRDAAFGPRPLRSPGISAERSLALAAGAARIGYGEYWVRAGKLEARLTIEDPQTQKMTHVLLASGPASGPLAAADALARQISSRAQSYPTRSQVALQAYVQAIESNKLADRTHDLEEAIAADPNFGPPCLLLAQLKAGQQDRAAALSLLGQALSRKMPALDQARLAFLAASLRGDSQAARAALQGWSRANANDPEVWSAIATDAMTRHRYEDALAAYQKATAVEPQDANLLNQLGYSAAYAGRWDNAMNALQRYQALRPNDPNPLDSMGDVNLVLGRLREAENFYLQAVKRDPGFLNGGDLFKAAMARLLSGDVSGADVLAKRFTDARAAAKDPLADFQRASWSWITGRRKQGYREMQNFAAATENGPLRQAASEAYSQLSIWSVALGNRSAAAQLAEEAAALSGPASASLAAMARFLAQPSAPESEWVSRADRAFPNPAQEQEKKAVLSYALVADKKFAAAAQALDSVFDHMAVTSEPDLPVVLAWAQLESGQPGRAGALLRFNPIPSPAGVRPLSVFAFPQLLYLRGRLAALAGNASQAQSYYKLFSQLSGDKPLVWDEQTLARQ